MIEIMSDWTQALEPFLAETLKIESGATLFRQNEQVRHVFVVRSGCVHLVRYGAEGTMAVMQRATAGNVLAESSVFSESYHCDGLCVSDATVARADMRRVRAAIEADPGLLRTLTKHLAREVQRTRGRVELLSRRTVAERLDGWFALHGDALPERGQWRAVAEDIGVSPEAFYRELQRRRQTL